MKIRKEFISEVLGYRVQKDILINEESNIKIDFKYVQTKYDNDEIGICKLSELFKEWAFKYSLVREEEFELTENIFNGKNPLRLLSGRSSGNYGVGDFECSIDNFTRGAYASSKIFLGNSEFEAILKACEWIYNIIKGKKDEL